MESVKRMKYQLTFIVLWLTGMVGLAQTNYTAAMVDPAGVFYRPTNVWQANASGIITVMNPYFTNGVITTNGTGLGDGQVAQLVLTNVGVQPRLGIVTVMFENGGGAYVETAQFLYAASSTDAGLDRLGSVVMPTNKVAMTFGAQRSGSQVTFSFTNQNTNTVNWRIWLFGRLAP